jgi:hypothetical protein
LISIALLRFQADGEFARTEAKLLGAISRAALPTASKSVALSFVFALQRAQAIEQIEYHPDARQIDAEIVAQTSDQAQPGHRGGFEKQSRPFARARFDQTAFDETFDKGRVHLGAVGQRLQGQITFRPANNQLVSA